MSEPEEQPGEHRGGRNLPVAIATGLVLAGLIFLTLLTSRIAWFLLVSAAVLLAQVEFYRVLRGKGYRPAETLGIAGGALLLVGTLQRGPAALSFGLVMVALASFLWFLVDPHRERVVQSLGVTLLGVIYVPFLGAHVQLMRDLPGGIEITIAYIGLTAFYDIAAYASGSFFGKRPMAPTISPKKSWEGAIGATLFIFVLALLIGPLFDPFDAAAAAMVAAAVAVLAPIGDLAESLIKRDLGVKDMGALLPGHGGMLDRIDALLLVAPAFYWIIRVVAV